MPFAPSTTIAPHSLEAEQVTIGALLVDPERMMDVAPLLKASDFYDPVLRTIYEAITALYDERSPIDLVTVSQKLADNRKIQNIGGSAFLAELISQTPTAAHVEKYADIVRAKSMRRKLARAASTIQSLSLDDDIKTTAELLEAAEKELLALTTQTTQAKPIDLTAMTTERYEHYTAVHEADDPAAHYGIRTGFPTLDELLTGLPAGHLMILAGRPSMGKTALALNIARNVSYAQDKKVAIFSLEMTKEELADRILGSILGVEPSRLKRGDLDEMHYARMGQEFDKLIAERLFIDDDADTTLGNLRSKARRQQMEHGLDLLIVDYLQLIEVTDRAAAENQTQRITYICKRLKHLARELACPVVAL